MTGPLQFAVRVGIPGSLTIEVQAAPGLTPQPHNLNPPLRQGIVGDGMITTSWGIGWATSIAQRLGELGGLTEQQILVFECPSLDTTDSGWYATGTVDGTTDPVTLIAPLTGTSVYGRQFAAGDYILWKDATARNGLYSYEIDQIQSVSGATFTLQRGSKGAGGAQFGSPKTPHTSQRFYQLIDKTFPVLWEGEWQVYKFLWDQMIVAAVSGNTIDLGSPAVINLATIPPSSASPGLST